MKTLYHRANKLVSDPDELLKEKEHVRKALRANGYPEWMLDEPDQEDPNEQNNTEEPTQGNNDNRCNHPDRSTTTPKKYPVVIPYIKGLSEQLRRMFKKFNVPVYFKPNNTLRQLLVRPKDKLSKEKVVGPIYQITCETCTDSYIGKTERSLKQRFLEHRRPSSKNSEVSQHIHVDHPDHSVSLDEAKILDVEPRWRERGIKEAIYIRKLQPSLNRDGGRFKLSGVWTNLLWRGRDQGPGPRTSTRVSQHHDH